MRIVLLKAQEINGKPFPLGQKLDVTPELFATLDAEIYTGQWPPNVKKGSKTKLKTDFFKPKNIK